MAVFFVIENRCFFLAFNQLDYSLKTWKIMKNLCQFAEMILQRNSIETMIEVVCSLSEEQIKQIVDDGK